MEPPDVFPDKIISRRPDNAAVDNQVLKIAYGRLLLKLPHGRAFDVKTSHGPALGHGLLGGKIIFRFPGDFIKRYAVFADIFYRIPDHPQAAVAKKIDLHQSSRFGAILFPLNNWYALGRPFHGNIPVNGLGRDDHSARMHR